MENPYFLCIDVGTSGIKTAVVDVNGEVTAEAYVEMRMTYPQPGWVEQDPEELYSGVLGTMRRCVKESKIDQASVAGIGVTGFMCGLIPVDGDGKPLTSLITWLDTRNEEQMRRVEKEHGLMIQRTVGYPMSTAYDSTRMMWLKEKRPEIYREARLLLMSANTYVNMRLANNVEAATAINRNSLSCTGMYDPKRMDWSQKLLDVHGIPREKLPDVVDVWTVVGELSKEAADKTLLKRGIPIVAGGGDFMNTCLGAGQTEKGICVDVAGTASCLSPCTDRFIVDTKYNVLPSRPSVIPGLWIVAPVVAAGQNQAWFRDNVATLGSGRTEGVNPYRVLDDEASKVPPGSNKLIFIPHMAGRISPNNPEVRGAWLGLRYGHERGHLFRSMLEGVAYEYRYYLDVFRDYAISIKEVRAIGGGSRSGIWNQIKADVLNIPYVRLNRNEGGVLGTAAIIGYGVDVFTDLKSPIREWVHPVEKIEPRQEVNEVYEQYSKIYMKLLSDLEASFRSLNSVKGR